ncbi:hypothetical protein FRC11_004775 [Ceratobasidium sp. 423]|nr:hypothetical protein FRC11_004775 [Ceratobasidium sp. 423]
MNRSAFSLCAVPETGFDLSYESLPSHEAHQAIRELKSPNPKFHAEITAGRPIMLSEEDVEAEESENNPTHTDELTLAQHVQIVMASDNATELAASMDQVDHSVDESDDESSYEPPVFDSVGSSFEPDLAPTRRELPQ